MFGYLNIQMDIISEMPTIDFLYGGYWIQMSVDDYIFDNYDGTGII